MTWAALIALDAWPARCCIKVDDAPVGIVEGREAGCWTVGLAGSGNGMGLSHADYRALPEAQRQTRCEASAQVLRDAGADYVIEDVSQLMPVVHAIARRLAKEKPQGKQCRHEKRYGAYGRRPSRRCSSRCAADVRFPNFSAMECS
jgi:phosphonoacetaldehyde hydrolase